IRFGQLTPNQVHALGNADEPRSLGERLRRDMTAGTRASLIIMQWIRLITIGVRQKNFARFMGVICIAGHLKDQTVVYKLARVFAMDPHDRVSIEIESRFRRITAEHMPANRTNVLPFPIADLFSLTQARAVRGANVIMAPVTAARGQDDGFL